MMHDADADADLAAAIAASLADAPSGGGGGGGEPLLGDVVRRVIDADNSCLFNAVRVLTVCLTRGACGCQSWEHGESFQSTRQCRRPTRNYLVTAPTHQATEPFCPQPEDPTVRVDTEGQQWERNIYARLPPREGG
jgi:hypothetical protein